MSTSLTAKWLSRTLKDALVAPLLDGLNDARPRGSSKLGLDNLCRIFAADGTVIGPDVQAGSLVTADGEAIILRIEVGKAASDHAIFCCGPVGYLPINGVCDRV